MRSCSFLPALVVAFSAFLCGCGKGPNTSSSKIYLVNQTIQEFPNSGDQKDTAQYHYDANNRITDYGLINNGKYEPLGIYSYDSNNRVVSVKNYNPDGSVLSTNTFTYQTTSFTLTWSYPNGQSNQEVYTLNDKQQVIKAENQNFYNLYTYDDGGNVISYKSYAEPNQPPVNQGGTFSYDSFKNPFSVLQGNYAFMFTVDSRPNTCVNNVLANLSYEYNKDGYPTEVIDPNEGGAITYYSYTIK